MPKTPFIGIIPARYASTRFPGKPLADIGGKTMIQRVYEQAAKALPTVTVATDDDRIYDEVIRFGGNVVMTSPHHQSGTDRCAEALEKAQKTMKQSFEVVINIQGDEPFIAPEQIDLLCECFKDEKTDIATLIKPITQNEMIFDPNKPKVVVNNDQQAIYFSRSPIPYLRGIEHNQWHKVHTFYQHIGLYAYRTRVLKEITHLPQSRLELAESLEQLRWIENNYTIAVRETHHESIGIDSPQDLEHLKQMGLI
ncbi:3-deoxy-manno-octulosonate cytidylyltransferase (CMP-KDO synthetase) [Breznakibacter xylanolyticus]|uniref:3-deoxy-manno-octulosonate cytidylyltransferase n=1 Tax=Breznakibacter xylanolyticus TaxID=990 RepID=A0A2W7NJJ3_9BACT|nr:3-deoxy-manno-octulosonate cytidylyltransferase [Breznakibacter xylanolyticus]PZX20631.1 3-deoxy-manno-octulosonate cytidylyltransferase (CMP-KDO synthetase) [Breznakibacter xylanolyticus]